MQYTSTKTFLLPLHHTEPSEHWSLACVDFETNTINSYDSLVSLTRFQAVVKKLRAWMALINPGGTTEVESHRIVRSIFLLINLLLIVSQAN